MFIDYVERKDTVIGTLDSLVLASRRDDIQIITSTFSMAEAAYAERERVQGLVDPTTFTLIDELWGDRSVVTVVEVDPLIAMLAREIVRRGLNESRSLRAADAVHLATARQYSCTDFHTSDEKLQRWNGEWFPVREPFSDWPMLPLGQ